MNQRHAAAMTAEPGPPVRREPPRSVMVAVRLMYAGAALTAIGLVIRVFGVATREEALRARHTIATMAELYATQTFPIPSSVVSFLIISVVWLLFVWANL